MQKTIKEPVTVSGLGLHTGRNVNLTFRPAPAGHGFVFKRTDMEGQPEIEAVADHVVDTSRGTTLGIGEAKVYTVEHVLSALAGLEIDNCLIEMDGPETPIIDGSSSAYVKALQEAGFETQDAEREYLELDTVVKYYDAENKIEMTAVPHSEYKVSVMIDFETRVLSTQNATLHTLGDYAAQISPCRTFVFLHELEYLLKNNLIKGGDLSNAIVFVNKAVTQEELDRLAALFNKPTVEVKSEGILNNLDLHFQNEPARHKLLDVVGDLALVGRPLKAHVFASRPGHMANVEFARLLRKELLKNKPGENIPEYDPGAKPLFDINDIMRYLPHRPPFLLVDRIMEMSDTHVIGVKNVTMNESFFVGHFPDEPVMPGVLQIEAMAQSGGILVLSTVPDPENYITYFLKIDEVKFRNKVVPGDTILFKLDLLAPIRRGLCHMKGTAYVGKKVVMEAVMLAQIVKKTK
ncbi:MAG: bifunctional UDP-3-O-[3-hydroxymyristoyl] N-acetylglucosamine deacetylase/3-hydroxyacyl-ACP dehydratase [Bacteroidales bacterium]